MKSEFETSEGGKGIHSRDYQCNYWKHLRW